MRAGPGTPSGFDCKGVSRRRALGLGAGLVVASISGLARGATGAAPEPALPRQRVGRIAGPTFFVLGVYIAPPDQMGRWAERGVNTIIDVSGGVDPDLHHETALSLGLSMIRGPRDGRLREDLECAEVVALSTEDEPTNIVAGAVRDTPADVMAQLHPWRIMAADLGIKKPIFTNHVGNHIFEDNSRIGLRLADYHRISDWHGADIYQIADRRENLVVRAGSVSTYQGHVLRLQAEMAPGAALLTFLQTSAFAANQRVPSPGELKTQIWSAVVNGASMIALFPVRLPPEWSWDATPPELAETVRREFAGVAALGDILIDTERGGARGATIHPARAPGVERVADNLSFPFEGRVVDAPGGPYGIVVNLSPESATLADRTWAPKALALGPHEVRHGPIGSIE